MVWLVFLNHYYCDCKCHLLKDNDAVIHSKGKIFFRINELMALVAPAQIKYSWCLKIPPTEMQLAILQLGSLVKWTVAHVARNLVAITHRSFARWKQLRLPSLQVHWQPRNLN